MNDRRKTAKKYREMYANIAAKKHISEARSFSAELGGTDIDVKEYFFNLSGHTLEGIFREYGKAFGAKAEAYARATLQKWKSGSTQMSGLVAQRLFKLLPPTMPPTKRYELASNVWRHFGPRSSSAFSVGPSADAKAVIDTIYALIEKVIVNYKIPDNVRHRFAWLSAGDVNVTEELLNHFLSLERQVAMERLTHELPLLQKQMLEHGDKTAVARSKIEINRSSIEIWIDPKLGKEFREGVPKTRFGSKSFWDIIIGLLIFLALAAVISRR